MPFQGHMTIVGPASFSVLMQSNGKPYLFVDVFFDGSGKKGRDISIGFVLVGETAKQVDEFIGDDRTGELVACGQLNTRSYKQGNTTKISTGLEITALSIGRDGSTTNLMLDCNFLRFR